MSSTELAGLSRRIRSVRRNLRRQLHGSQGSWSGLSASCVRQALVWSQEKMSRHSLDAAAAYLARSGDCAGGRVGEGCLRCFVCRYFGWAQTHLHRSCTGLVVSVYNTCFMIGSSLKMSGPHKAAASKTGFALCSGRPSRGCREPPVFAFPWWPSIPTDIFETFSESLNGRIGTLPVTASLPIHVLQEKAWNWSGWVSLVPNFESSFGTPIWGPHGSDK